MNSTLSLYSPKIIEKAKKIRAVITDVDGVLTNGMITYDSQGVETKSFNVKDGMIVAHLRQAGIVVGLITGRNSPVVTKRGEELSLDFMFQGSVDKLADYEKIKSRYSLADEHVAYLGDDINDLSLLRIVGLSMTPADSPSYIRQKADLVTERSGGEGVLREAGDLILAAKGILDKLL